MAALRLEVPRPNLSRSAPVRSARPDGAGVPQKTATTITGHKTIAVFQRYHIVAPSELKEATRKLEISQKQERDLLKSQALEFGQSSGRVARKTGQTVNASISAARATVLPN